MTRNAPEIDFLPDNTILWRYMRFEGLASLLYNSALWFNRIDRFPDKSEGLYPSPYYDESFLNQQFERIHSKDPFPEGFGPKWQADQAITRHKLQTRHRIRWAVNCWHINKSESEAFWKIYSDLSTGIAVRTTLGSLRSSFNDPKYQPRIELVKYINRDRYKEIPPDIGPVIRKSDAYYYENEIRAIIDLTQDLSQPPMVQFYVDKNKPSDEIEIPNNSKLKAVENLRGANVEVDLTNLITEVVLSPLSKDWQMELVKKMVDSFQIGCKCRKSNIYDYPDLR